MFLSHNMLGNNLITVKLFDLFSIDTFGVPTLVYNSTHCDDNAKKCLSNTHVYANTVIKSKAGSRG